MKGGGRSGDAISSRDRVADTPVGYPEQIQRAKSLPSLDAMMRPISSDLVRRARIPGYLVMAFLIVSPLIELCAAAWPFQIRQAAWRLSFVGTAGASLGLPILGLFLTFLLAALVADKFAMWIVSAFSVFGGVLCFLEAGVFSLDALEMKSHVRAALTQRYDAMSAWWLLKLCAAGVILLAMAVSSYRAAKHVRREPDLGHEKSASWLVSSGGPPPTTVGAHPHSTSAG